MNERQIETGRKGPPQKMWKEEKLTEGKRKKMKKVKRDRRLAARLIGGLVAWLKARWVAQLDFGLIK